VNLFYATFIPGLQNFIAEVIKERLSDVITHKLLDGAVLFETETSYDKLNFLCFNNIFAVINWEEVDLEKHIKLFINENCDCGNDVIADNNKSFHSFRIIVSNENVPAAIDEKLRAQAEKRIARLSGLKVNRTLCDTEFWFLYRSEGFSVFMKRLTLRSSWEKTLHKGELPPPLAWILCRMANLSHADTVLDPFCGYGSIPDAALKYFHITKFIACDNNMEAFKHTGERSKKRKNGAVTLHNADFEKLPLLIKEKTVDVIVTDPPWGHYEEIDKNGFYAKMFEVFNKLLKDGGDSEVSGARAVVLCANDGSFKDVIPECFKIQTQTPILLSGRKAIIYVLKRFACLKS